MTKRSLFAITRYSVSSTMRLSAILIGACLTLCAYGASENTTEEYSTKEILEARSVQNGERFILTRKAAAIVTQMDAKEFMERRTKRTTVGRWIVIHENDEDIAEIQRRAKQNLRIWQTTLSAGLPTDPLYNNKVWGAQITAINVLLSQFCLIDLEFHLAKPIDVFFIDVKGTAKNILCRDYMLILAANDIIVRKENDHLVAELKGKSANALQDIRDVITDKFITTLKEEGPDAALSYIYSATADFETKKAKFESVKSQFVAVVKQLGELHGCEFLVSGAVGSRYEVRKYLCMYRLVPIRVQFDFYRPKDEWQAQGFGTIPGSIT